MRLTILAATAAALALCPTAASAALLNFTFTGGYTASFQLDSNPTPSRFDNDGAAFDNTSGTFNGTAGSNIVSVFLAASGGGVGIYTMPTGDSTVADLSGEQIFTGPLSMPVFAPGTFALSNGSTPVTLTISAVPEASTWAMMLVGMGMVAGGARSRRRSAKVSFA